MKSIPLRFTIGLSYILLILLTSITIIFFTYRSGRNDVQNLASELHAQTYKRIKEQIDNFVSTPQEVNKDILSNIQSGLININDFDVLKKQLLSQLLAHKTVISMEYADENRNDFGPSRNIFDTPLSFGESGKSTGYVYHLYQIDEKGNRGKVLWESANYDPREKSWYQDAVKSGVPSWTPIYLWPNGDVGIDAVAPLKTNDKLVGVFDTAITLNEFSDFLQGIKFTKNSQIYILERSGDIVAGTDIPQPYSKNGDTLTRIKASESNVQDLQIVTQQLKKTNTVWNDIKSETQFITGTSDRHFVTISPYYDVNGLNWLVITTTPESDIMANLLSSTYTNVRIIGGAILLSLLIAIFIAWWITSPVTKLSNYALSLSQGNWDQEVNIHRNDEIGGLAESFRIMSRDLKQKTHTLNENARLISSEKQKLEAVLKSMADGVCVTDNHQNIILVNNSFSKIIGFSADELLKTNMNKLIKQIISKPEDKEKFKDISDMLFSNSGGVVYFDAITIKNKSKKLAIINGVGSRLRNSDGKIVGIVLVIRDVTTQTEFEKMKEGFVSLASHQLRTPLTGIKWSISLLKDLKSQSPQMKSLIKQVDKSNGKMISLVNGLLSVSRIEAGTQETRNEIVSIKDILKESLVEEGGILKQKDIQVVGVLGVDKNILLRGDREQLVQMFDNIINNGAQYSEKHTKINVMTEVKDKHVTVSITDHGVGIPKDQQNKVFEKFYRASNVANKIPGTGLGLYYVRQVAEKHHGKVWFNSEEGKGTTFHISLPVITQKNGL